MKKTVYTVLIIIMILILAISFAACGQNGKSAYEIACENGFVGTEQEWIESLKGSNGKNGQDGRDGSIIDIYSLYEIYSEENPGITFNEYLNSFMVVDYYDTEYAAAKGLLSIVSVYSEFKSGGISNNTYYSAGAGVIYKMEADNVYIITNYHVVYDSDSSNNIASQITVYPYGYYEGIVCEFLGGSITKDIALLKASKNEFASYIKPVQISDSNNIYLGERVVAIGNPLAEGISVTSGIISVDSQEIEMEALDFAAMTNTMRVIRTDTSINSGNSGGGLFNIRGELIGIVNAKTIESGVENMGYAIPVNVAAGIADCVIENNSKKGLVGITVQVESTTTAYNSSTNKIEIIESLKVIEVTSGSLADGNILSDDRLISARINDGEALAITRLFHLSDYLYKVRQGDKLYIEVERGGVLTLIEMTVRANDFISV